MTASVHFAQREPVTIAHLEGEIDMDNVEAISMQLRNGIANDAAGLVLDCVDVQYIDSAGVRMLFELARQLNSTRRAMALVVDESSPIRRLLSVTHMDAAAPIYANLSAAVERVGALDRDRIG